MGRLAVRAPPTRNRGRNRALRGRLRLPVSGCFDRRWVRRSPAHLLPPPADRTRSSRQHMHGHPVNAPTYPTNPAHGPHGEGTRGKGTGRERRGEGRCQVTSGRCAYAWRGGAGRPWRGAAGPGRAAPVPRSAPAGTVPAAAGARPRSPARFPAPPVRHACHLFGPSHRHPHPFHGFVHGLIHGLIHGFVDGPVRGFVLVTRAAPPVPRAVPTAGGPVRPALRGARRFRRSALSAVPVAPRVVRPGGRGETLFGSGMGSPPSGVGRSVAAPFIPLSLRWRV